MLRRGDYDLMTLFGACFYSPGVLVLGIHVGIVSRAFGVLVLYPIWWFLFRTVVYAEQPVLVMSNAELEAMGIYTY